MEMIKRHPKIAIGALLAGVAVIAYSTLSGGGGGATTTGTDPNAIAAGVALQQSQMAQQTQLANNADALQAQQGNNATSIALADLQGKYSYDIASLAADVQTQTINATAQTNALQYTLAAQVQNNQTNAQVQEAAIAGNTTIQTTQAVAGALVAESAQQASVAMAAISNQCHGFGCLF